jgi:hypothetical protein
MKALASLVHVCIQVAQQADCQALTAFFSHYHDTLLQCHIHSKHGLVRAEGLYHLTSGHVHECPSCLQFCGDFQNDSIRAAGCTDGLSYYNDISFLVSCLQIHLSNDHATWIYVNR